MSKKYAPSDICNCGHPKLNHHYRHPFRPSGRHVKKWRRGNARCSTCKRHGDRRCGHSRVGLVVPQHIITKKEIEAFYRIPWSRFDHKPTKRKRQRSKWRYGAARCYSCLHYGYSKCGHRAGTTGKKISATSYKVPRSKTYYPVGHKKHKKHKNHRKNIFDKFTKKDWDTYKSLYLTAD